ncbi:MAG: hypothetical protein DHS20C16_33240 [Phycisphaerae bacterium]|nr:MAG: hypothetical protein DHS20C16_33240 [Phycisphaerae bacterium]
MNSDQMTQRSAASRCETKRFFTPAQANSALPLVQRIVSDIVAQFQQLEHLQKKRQKITVQERPDDVRALDALASQGTQRLNDLIDEIRLIGCELKDWTIGLVDFPAILDGREVYLCWKLGEEQIGHWHEVHAGAMGRQPVGDDFNS